MESIEFTTNFTENTCNLHKLKFIECTSKDCKKKEVCKLCALESKEGVQHLSNHYEFLKEDSPKNDISDTFTQESLNLIKDQEIYADLNKHFRFLEKS